MTILKDTTKTFEKISKERQKREAIRKLESCGFAIEPMNCTFEHVEIVPFILDNRHENH